MITDNDVLEEVRADWEFVQTRVDWIKMHLFASTGMDGIFPHKIADFCNTLVLVFAYGVLQRVLEQLRSEGVFDGGSNRLGALMSASRGSLSWIDWGLVDHGRDERNKVAHKEHQVLPRADVWKYLNAIDAELTEWGIMPKCEPKL